MGPSEIHRVFLTLTAALNGRNTAELMAEKEEFWSLSTFCHTILSCGRPWPQPAYYTQDYITV